MKPYKKSQRAKTTLYNKEYKIVTRGWEDPCWNDYVQRYPRYRIGFKNPNRRLMSYQIRMYKTWKHNRKTQWKNGNRKRYNEKNK